MAKYNVLQEKSFAFAVRIVKLYKFLCEYVLSKQNLIQPLLILNF